VRGGLIQVQLFPGETISEASSGLFPESLSLLCTEGLEAGEYLLYLFADELTTGAKSQANAYFKAK